MKQLERSFPKIVQGGYRITSPVDSGYNCIAWAAGVTDEWWWPLDQKDCSWPKLATLERTISAFIEVFSSLGYVTGSATDSLALEQIAIYTLMGLPTHAARQLTSGLWTSKIGEGPDIEHQLFDLEGAIYGTVEVYLHRPRRSK